MVSDTIDPVVAFNEFIREFRDESGNYIYREQIQEMTEEGEISLKVDFCDVIKFNPELARRTIDEPKEFIEAGNRAVTEVAEIEDSDYAFTTRNFFIRFYNMIESETIPLRGIRAEHVGKLIQLDGVIVDINPTKPILIEGFFVCQNCNEIMILLQEEDQYTPPHHCNNPGCGRKGPFKLLSEESKYIDLQILTISEMPSSNSDKKADIKLDIHLFNDLVNGWKVNDIVRLTGIVNLYQKSAKKAAFEKRIFVNHISKEGEITEIKTKDTGTKKTIREIHRITESRCFKINEPTCPKNLKIKPKQVFIAMPFRDKYMELYKEAIKPSLEELKFKPIKSDDEHVTMDLMCHICGLIRESNYAIVNITDENPNVMFELGLIFGLGKTTIILKEESASVPADLKAMFYLPYKFGFYEELRKNLTQKINSIFK